MSLKRIHYSTEGRNDVSISAEVSCNIIAYNPLASNSDYLEC